MEEIRFAIAQLVLALQVEGVRRPLAIVMATDDDPSLLKALTPSNAAYASTTAAGFSIDGVAVIGPGAMRRP